MICRAAVSREPFLTCAGLVVDRAFFQVQSVHRIALAQSQPHLVPREINRARAVQWGAGNGSAIGSSFSLAGPGKGNNAPSVQIHPTYAVIANVADVQFAVGAELDAVWRLQPCLNRLTAIAGKACISSTGHGADAAGLGVHAPDKVVFHLHEKHVARAVETHLVRLVQACLGGKAAVAAPTFLAGTSHGGDDAGFSVHTADGVVEGIAKVQGTIWPAHHAEWAVDACLGGRTAIAGVSGFSRSRKSVNDCCSARKGQNHRQKQYESAIHGAPHRHIAKTASMYFMPHTLRLPPRLLKNSREGDLPPVGEQDLHGG